LEIHITKQTGNLKKNPPGGVVWILTWQDILRNMLGYLPYTTESFKNLNDTFHRGLIRINLCPMASRAALKILKAP